MTELELLHKRRIFIQERIKSLTDIESNFEEIMSLLDEEEQILHKIRFQTLQLN